MVIKFRSYVIIAIYSTAIMLFFYVGYSDRHIRLPEGYDEFGYLNMAKAASNGMIFKNHADRPFDSELLKYLSRSGFPFESYAYPICPHAYHLKAGRVINQYPPGTGILLSILPFDIRKTASPALSALLVIVFLFPAFKLKTGRLSFSSINMAAVFMLITFLLCLFPRSFPVFSTVNSLAPTFGMLLAAGYLLDKRPVLSFTLLGTSTFFRIGNGILVIPFLIIYLYNKDRWISGYFSKEALYKFLGATVRVFLGGAAMYFIYVWLLLGTPFSTTYPDFDGRFALIGDIPVNICYYIKSRWFLLQVSALLLISVMGIFRKIPLRWVIFSFFIFLFNYCFYFVHMVREGYYAYASGVVILGIIINLLEDHINATKIFKRLINTAGITFVTASLLFSIVWFPRLDIHQVLHDQIDSYQKRFSSYDVIWAGNRGGTIEYATGKVAFRFDFGTPGMQKNVPVWGPENHRKDIMLWLNKHGYHQAIWVSDLQSVDTALQVKAEEELKNIPLCYEVKTDPTFGTIIGIK